MKTYPFLLAALATALLVAGCSKQDSVADQMDKVKSDTKAAAQTVADYTYAQKDEFVQAMQTQLTTLNQDLDTLAAKIETASDSVKAEANPKLQALRDQAAKLNTQLEDAKNANQSTWNDVKSGFQKGWDGLKDGVQQARQWLSDKIAP